jgi:hypothetical protein
VESNSRSVSHHDGELRASTPSTSAICGASAHALVVSRLLGQVREQVSEPPAREAQEPALGGAIQQHLRDRQTDQLGVGDRWAAPCTWPTRQDLVSQHVKCRQKVVEVGDHAATSVVDVGVSNADVRRPFYLPSNRTAQPGRNGINHLAGQEPVWASA